MVMLYYVVLGRYLLCLPAYFDKQLRNSIGNQSGKEKKNRTSVLLYSVQIVCSSVASAVGHRFSLGSLGMGIIPACCLYLAKIAWRHRCAEHLKTRGWSGVTGYDVLSGRYVFLPVLL